MRMNKILLMTGVSCVMGILWGEDLMVSSDMTIDGEATYDAVTFENNAKLTLKTGEKYFTFGTLAGTGTIILDNGARLQSSATGTGVVPESVTIHVNGTTEWKNRLSAHNNDLKVYGPLTGSGTICLNFNGDNFKGVQLYGDNSQFEGTILLDSNGNVRNKIGAAQAGGKKLRFVNKGNAQDNGTVTFDGDAEGSTTLFLGSVYTDARTEGNYPWRFKNAGIITLETGHLNRDDDRISIRLGENGLNSGNVRIRKVGTGTLELWNPGHRYGTLIDEGTVLVTSHRALDKYVTTSPITFGSTADSPGGVLKYGNDPSVLDESGNPMAVTNDYSTMITNSQGFIGVDTDGKEIVWAAQNYTTANPNMRGFVKKGEGILRLSAYQDPVMAVFTTTSRTNVIEAGTLAIRNGRRGQTPELQSKLLGSGTLRIEPFEDNGGFRLKNKDALSEFEGTIDWANDQDQSGKAIGFLPGSYTDWDLGKIRFRVTGEPTDKVQVLRSEMSANRTLTLGAMDHLSANADFRFNNALNLVLTGAKGDSALNGTFSNAKVYLKKNAAAKLTLGADFNMLAESTVTVEGGVFENHADLANYTVTIADGTRLVGDFTSVPAAKLANYSVVLPVKSTLDKDATYDLVKVPAGAAGPTVDLASLNEGETKGSWKIRGTSDASGNKTYSLYWAKRGFVVVFR